MEHYELGIKGEKIAQKYLIKNNYRILETNWRSKGYEVDIIASYKNTIVIVEVKTRSSTKFNQPHDAVNRSKQNSIIRVAESYVFSNQLNMEVRFDIITVILNQNVCKIKHIENAFYPLI
ncbi:YraN family protein [Bacteroidota bacterium]